ncbi:Sec63 Brl domain-containing protein [Fomitopsis serialis]|uniref:Sec63 Brl domain-containing protein n=1 Tax=Fomitopsis serialis TaxID=139415 RepID=UPI0020089392|nr:Sec63 Brl domain-containing protein [Neoantrodia serialis]KAH9911636.1 Sec63 Brl domain-containing protein [Neoantrodia serialis]
MCRRRSVGRKFFGVLKRPWSDFHDGHWVKRVEAMIPSSEGGSASASIVQTNVRTSGSMCELAATCKKAKTAQPKPTLNFFASACAGLALGALAAAKGNPEAPGMSPASHSGSRKGMSSGMDEPSEAERCNPAALFALSEQALGLAERTAAYDINSAGAMILQLLYLLHCCPGGTSVQQGVFPLASRLACCVGLVTVLAVGKMINVARMMGLANEPDKFSGTYSLFDAEARRRVWWDVLYYDLFVSDCMGHPSLMPDKSFTTRLPADVDEDAFGPSSTKLRGVSETGDGADKGYAYLPKATVDLEGMAFSHGGHLMSNKKCKLPEGSFKRSKKGYEEIHDPAPKQKPLAPDELVPVTALPEWAQQEFSDMKNLNRVQSKLYPVTFGTDEPLLLCAPTGAGKTSVAMLTVLNELGKHRDEQTGAFDLDSFEIVYVAPMKALVQEMIGNFSTRLGVFGVKVGELTGDSQMTKQQITETQIIVTTPEKYDIITRKGTDTSYTNLVRLIIIDEIHLLHDERGPVLERIIARTIRRMDQTGEYVRLVGLSATLPNYQDVATFLRVDPAKGLFYFDASYRPCVLQQQFIGVTEKKAIKHYQVMNEVCYEKVLDQAGKNQTLVFVHSRKETAKSIRDMAIDKETITQFVKPDGATREILLEESNNVKDPNLKDVLQFGFGIHHAGMSREDRGLVEELFADGHLQVLGTQIYNPEKGRWVELSSQDVLQMLGCAGRPQYDTFGEGIIITNHSELQYYLSLMNQQLPIESQFVAKLADNLNTEIVLRTIRNRDEAVQWFGYTYLPRTQKCHLVKYERASGRFHSTELVVSHYYVTYNSMATYHQHLRLTMTMLELFRVFALSNEFKLLPLRQEEKLELGKLLERVLIPVKESVEEPAAKINVLLQAYVSQQSAGRILRAMFEICLKRGWAVPAKDCHALCEMVERRMWGSMTPLRQFKGVPAEVVRKAEGKQFPWYRYFDLNPPEIVQPITRTLLRIDLTIIPDFRWDEKIHGTAESFWIMVEDVDGEIVLFHDTFILRQRYAEDEHNVTLTVPMFEPVPPNYYISIVSDRWLHAETRLPILFKHLILPEKFPQRTPILDLQPLLLSVLHNKEFESIYSSTIQIFNEIQIQWEDRLCGVALLRLWSKRGEQCAVCIEPYQEMVDVRVAEWRNKFGGLQGGKEIVSLTGETSADLRLLEKGDVMVCTPAQWDVLSRRWRQRKNVQTIGLLIAVKFNLSATEIKTRIVACGVSLANARDLAFNSMFFSLYELPTTMGSRTRSAARKQASASNDGSKTKRGAGQQDRAKTSKSGSDSIPNINTSGLSPADRQALAKLRKMALEASKSAKESHQKDVRKRSAAMMVNDHQSSGEEETQPVRHKKKKAVSDSEPAGDEDDMDVDHEGEEDEVPEDGGTADSSDEAGKSGKSGGMQSQTKVLPRPQPPRSKASSKGQPQSPRKAAKKATNLNDEEASIAQSLSKMATSKAKSKARQTTVLSDDEGSNADSHPQTTTQTAKKAQQDVSSSSTKNKPRGGGTSSQAAAKGKGKDIARVVTQAKSTTDSGASDLDKSDDERDAEPNAEDVDADDDEEDDDKDLEKGGEEESSENDDDDDDGDDDDDDDVVVLRDETREKGKRRRSKSTRNKRAKVTDLPLDLRALVTASQNCLRLRIALNTAWTSDRSIPSDRLPSRNKIIRDSVHDAHEMRDKNGRRIKALKSGFNMISDSKKGDGKVKKGDVKDEEAKNEEEARRAALQKAVYNVFRNELKKKAKAVVETVYGLHGLSAEQRSRAAAWLLMAHPTQVNDGTGSRNIPNFVFSDINIVFDDRKQLNVKESRFNEDEPFRHPAISELIFQHWALGARADANLHAAMDRFSQVPDNLIALVCNAIENALLEIMNHGSNFFTNKLFAVKWDGLIAILETLQEELPEYYDQTKKELWGHISGRLNLNVIEETEPVAKGASFLKFDRMRAKLSTRATSPSTSVAGAIAATKSTAKSTNANTNANANANAAKPPSSKGKPPSMKTAKTGSKSASANAKHAEQDPVDDGAQTAGASSSNLGAVQDGSEGEEPDEPQLEEDEIDEGEGP